MKVQTLLLLSSFGFFSCSRSSNNNNGDWLRRSDFNGNSRIGAVAFTLNNLGYVATGFDGSNYLNDVWYYDPNLDYWTSVDTLPSIGRALGVAFATSKFGYVGLGFNGTDNGTGTYFPTDFFKFDPSSNNWTPIPSPKLTNNGGVKTAVAFGIGAPYNIGGVLGGIDGNDNYHKEFYVWKEDSGGWVTEPFPGPKWAGAASWVYQNKGYVVTGTGDNQLNVSDFWFYDPSRPLGHRWSDSLRRIFGITDQSYDAGYRVQRTNAVAFTGVSNGIPKAYVTLGSNGPSQTDCWEYDFATDQWSVKSSFPGAGRVGAIAMTLNIKDPTTNTLVPHGYIGLGGQSLQNNGAGTGVFYSDITEFLPDLPFNPDDYNNQ
ncbi:Kelch repeat-containing protein [Dinghuibacter silviterrae]|uniref:Kelch motif protein n=1 Tax=Dinghuibacter silviterrae TaxID=1539049 RepID=A0A4R8DIW9_9BACT|nr:hypothetical protein [Dinghuibacter silviterrae]TDW97507.1 Kelch motif protein [Dinghuibacter silviterrae]